MRMIFAVLGGPPVDGPGRGTSVLLLLLLPYAISPDAASILLVRGQRATQDDDEDYEGFPPDNARAFRYPPFEHHLGRKRARTHTERSHGTDADARNGHGSRTGARSWREVGPRRRSHDSGPAASKAAWLVLRCGGC